jgi:hypothetical protein
MNSNRRSINLAIIMMGISTQPFFAASISSQTTIQDLHPFTHTVSIPASSDTETIRFEKVKLTKVFTKVRSTTNPGYCDELQFRDPGGSMYCAFTQKESPLPAYEVTYSYRGQPLTSDEYGNRYFTFQVYFQPEELPPALRKAISGKVNRAELATYFNMATSRPLVRVAETNEATSTFCPGTYVDGAWVQNSASCVDDVRSKIVTRRSESITVRVDPVSSRTREAVATR